MSGARRNLGLTLEFPLLFLAVRRPFAQRREIAWRPVSCSIEFPGQEASMIIGRVPPSNIGIAKVAATFFSSSYIICLGSLHMTNQMSRKFYEQILFYLFMYLDFCFNNLSY